MHLIYLTVSTVALLSELVTASAIPSGALPDQPPDTNNLPIIDLGYVKQRASSYNATGRYYNFSNIAYAQPPVGNLRFAAPQPPLPIQSIQDGNDKINPTCPQAWPIWLSEFSLKQSSVPRTPFETEDCLYLDVLVPEKVIQNKDNCAGAPVLFWIYGGGFVIGGKTQNGDGSGLVARSLEDPNDEGIIFVAPNYRLGAFGFLGGSEFVKQGGTPNAGLLDSRLALEWAQQHIAKFGGDPNRVTAIGESGGAISIAQHLTAGQNQYFDVCKTPFQQAIYQSPDEGVLELPSDAVFNTRFGAFLDTLGVHDLSGARNATFDQVYNANNATVAIYPGGQFNTFGVSYDGSYVLGTANQGLAAGRYDDDMSIITAHNSDEGLLFTATLDTPPTASNFSFAAYLKTIIPGASQATMDYITNDLYSLSKFGGSEFARTDAFNGEAFILGNFYGLQRAYGNQGFTYEFSVPPGVHTEDIAYTLYNGHNNETGPLNATIATDMQRYITQFAMTGNPNKDGFEPLPRSGENAALLSLNVSGYTYTDEPNVKSRCEFWEDFGS